MLVFESLWNRYRPGAHGLGVTIRMRQWTSLHLSATQRASGIIPLTHIGRILTFDRPEGPTWVHAHGRQYTAERIAHCLLVPPNILKAPIVHLRHTPSGFLLTHDTPSLTATTHLLSALRQAGWSPTSDPFDDEGTHILPALLHATRAYPTIRYRPTLPLTLIDSLKQPNTSLVAAVHTASLPGLAIP